MGAATVKMITGDLVKEYITKWKIDVNSPIADNISKIWVKINNYRKIGPAIIEDIYRYVFKSDPRNYVRPIIMYVLPQFEGLGVEGKKCLDELVTLDCIKGDQAELRIFAKEYLDIEIKNDG